MIPFSQGLGGRREKRVEQVEDWAKNCSPGNMVTREGKQVRRPLWLFVRVPDDVGRPGG